ncbi:amino acid permease-domain-containing protein [Aspergillus aurantiobrunneus]
MIGGGIFVSPGIVSLLTGNKMVSKVFPVPLLLFASAFSWVFIAFATPTTNSITFATHINPNKTEEPDVWFTKFFACVIVVGICDLHHRFVNTGIAANNLLAVFKGANGDLPGLGDFRTTGGSPSPTNIALGILQVLYSYQGWENANYVTSAIEGNKEHKQRTLKRGAFAAISVVATLHIAFNMFLFFILDSAQITSPRYNVVADYAIQVFQSNHVDTASHAIYVSIALTAAGNIIGVTFSNARASLKPFSGFFSRGSNYGSNKWDGLGMPTGGLVLQALVTFVLGIGVLFIRKCMDQYQTKSADPARIGYAVPWQCQVMKDSVVVPFIPSDNPEPSDNPNARRRYMPSWAQPVIAIALYAVGALVALYTLVFVRKLDFHGSGYNPSDLSNFVPYNERRFVCIPPLPWDEFQRRLRWNGEPKAAKELNREHLWRQTTIRM